MQIYVLIPQVTSISSKTFLNEDHSSLKPTLWKLLTIINLSARLASVTGVSCKDLVNSENHEGNTCLHLAVQGGHVEVSFHLFPQHRRHYNITAMIIRGMITNQLGRPVS